MIVSWGIAELPGVLDELSISRPLLISTEGAAFSYLCTIASTACARMPRSPA